MRIGLALPQLGAHVDAPAVREFCQRAEELGFDSLWAQEHLFYPHRPTTGYAGIPGAPVPDQYRSVLAATELMACAGAWTSRVRIGSSIFVGGYHRPVELAQRIATLDLLSQGRIIVGFAVGWSEDEHDQMDVDFRTRGRRLDELIRAVLACWGPDPVSFDGEFFRIPPSDVQPKPVQRPRPLLMSGMWSPAGLRRTVEHFDIWNPARGTPSEARDRVDNLNADRPPGTAPLALYFRSFTQRPSHRPGDPVPGVAGVLADADAARAAGVDEFIIDCNFWDEIDAPGVWARIPEVLSPVLRLASGA